MESGSMETLYLFLSKDDDRWQMLNMKENFGSRKKHTPNITTAKSKAYSPAK
jgi:hypothetical protein